MWVALRYCLATHVVLWRINVRCISDSILESESSILAGTSFGVSSNHNAQCLPSTALMCCALNILNCMADYFTSDMGTGTV
jgi:hypothetical protein